MGNGTYGQVYKVNNDLMVYYKKDMICVIGWIYPVQSQKDVFPLPRFKDLHLPVSASAALASYVWYVQACQDSCVFLYFLPFL